MQLGQVHTLKAVLASISGINGTDTQVSFTLLFANDDAILACLQDKNYCSGKWSLHSGAVVLCGPFAEICSC